MLADIGDGVWLSVLLVVDFVAGVALAVLVARRRGHLRVNIEVGDPPDRDTPPK